jgi:hypothetical protein
MSPSPTPHYFLAWATILMIESLRYATIRAQSEA